AHFRGARRWPGRDEGNIRIFIFAEGWFWWIPFAGDVTSVGCVLHSRTVRGRDGSLAGLFVAMIGRCHRVAEGLGRAQRVTDGHPRQRHRRAGGRRVHSPPPPHAAVARGVLRPRALEPLAPAAAWPPHRVPARMVRAAPAFPPPPGRRDGGT